MTELTANDIQTKIKEILENGGKVEIDEADVENKEKLKELREATLEKIAGDMAQALMELIKSIRIEYTGGLNVNLGSTEFIVEGEFGHQIKLIKEDEGH